MSSPTETPFQRLAAAKVQEVLTSRGISIAGRGAATARLPHMSESETVVKIVTEDGGQIWLYEDEATFSKGTLDRRFERADYGSSDALLRALLDAIDRA